MAILEQIVRAALDGDALGLRSLVQDWLREGPRIAEIACPTTHDPEVLAAAAAFAELFAQRTGQMAPAWTNAVAGLPEARFLSSLGDNHEETTQDV